MQHQPANENIFASQRRVGMHFPQHGLVNKQDQTQRPVAPFGLAATNKFQRQQTLPAAATTQSRLLTRTQQSTQPVSKFLPKTAAPSEPQFPKQPTTLHTHHNDDGDENGLVCLPQPTVIPFSLEDDEDVKDSFYLSLQQVTGADQSAIDVDGTPYDLNESLMALTEDMGKLSMKVNDYPTDYNDLTTLSTHADHLSITAIPVNCFSIITQNPNGSMTTATPQQSAVIKKEICALRHAVSFMRHQMLSATQSNPNQIIDSTQQLIQYIQTYNSRAPVYNPQHFESLRERRMIAVDYMFRTATIHRMSCETFCHGVHLLDRVFSMPNEIPISSIADIQLSSLVCLFLAYKMIEKRVANAATIIGTIGTNRFSKEDIQRREQIILNAFQFQIAPTSLSDIVLQLLLLFTSTRQRDTLFEERHETDDIHQKSGRFIRLKCMLNFLTYCCLTDPTYLSYNVFGLACSIFINALAMIHTDFSQVWPLSMAILTAVLPEDLHPSLSFVMRRVEAVKTTTNHQNRFVCSAALETFGTDQYYNVAAFPLMTERLLEQRIQQSHEIAQRFLTHYKVNLSLLSRIGGIEPGILRVGTIIDQRTITRRPNKPGFQSPARSSNSNPVGLKMSPILQREQQMQSQQAITTSNTEYLVVLFIDPSLQSSFSIDTTTSIQQSSIGTQPICIKVWMGEDAVVQLVNGEDALDQFALERAEKERAKAPIAATRPPQPTLPLPRSPFLPQHQSTMMPLSHDQLSTPKQTRKQPSGGYADPDLLSDFQSPKHLLPRHITAAAQIPNVPGNIQQQQQQQQLPPRPFTHMSSQTNLTFKPELSKQSLVTESVSKRKRVNADGDEGAKGPGCSIM